MEVTMERRWWAAFLFAVAVWPVFGFANAEASSMNGTWRIENLVLEIFDCQQLVCGRIVWIDEAAKRPTQCGKIIVWGLAQTGPITWKGGAIFDPNDGKTYRLSATFQPNGELRARIFQGIELLGKTKMLKRVGVNSLSGWC
jgi:uncharacterized protein (DUF2147 family)